MLHKTKIPTGAHFELYDNIQSSMITVKGYLENYFQPCFGIQMSACIYKSERGIF
jgi:hypothetical protein